MTEQTATERKHEKLAWAATLALYVSCWMLPILNNHIGVDGARIAHEEFWNLFTKDHPLDTTAEFFQIVFIAVGWLANELFVLGVVVVRKWPRLAMRAFAFSLGIMISWQIAFIPEEFPLLIGYWFWVAAGAMALWLAASRLARETGSRSGGVGSGGGVLAEPITLALLFLPNLNAILALALGA